MTQNTARDKPLDISCVFVLPSLSTGGAERVMITLLNNLPIAKKSLVTICASGEFVNFIKKSITVTNLGCHRTLSGLIPLTRYIRKNRPAVVMSTITHINFALLLIRPFLPKGTKVIVREATLPSYFLVKSPFKKLVARFGYKFLYPQADLVISPAQRIVNEFRDIYHLDISNHVVLQNPVDIDYLRARAEVGEDADEARDRHKIYFICVARLNWAKGLDRLIEKISAMPPDLDWHLTILGDGGERPRLEAMIAERGLEGRINMPGLAENPWYALARADVCLLPSRWEGLPNVVLESLAVGTPVIATREAGGIQEIADLAGDCIQIADSMDDFLQAMQEVKPLDRSGVRPSLLPEEYMLENVVEKFMALLE